MSKDIYKYIMVKDEELVKRNPVNSSDTGGSKTCGDCGQEIGEYHLMHCDMERCPVCKNQLFSCDCWTAYANK